MPTSVLVCGITQSDVAIHFTSSLLRMQTDLARTPDVAVNFEFFLTINDALKYFAEAPHFDVCVLIDGQMAVDPHFILHHDLDKHVVVASYPIRKIDWDRVRAKAHVTTEPAQHTGITYNYDPRRGEAEPGGKYLRLPARTPVQLKIFKLTRHALETMLQKCPQPGPNFVLHTGGVEESVGMTADERVCHLWGDAIYADITAKTQNIGPFDFTGTVGLRKRLR
jgi:hypothetical protein